MKWVQNLHCVALKRPVPIIHLYKMKTVLVMGEFSLLWGRSYLSLDNPIKKNHLLAFNRTSGCIITLYYFVAFGDIRTIKMGQFNTLLLFTSEVASSCQNVAFLFLKALLWFLATALHWICSITPFFIRHLGKTLSF